jgi:hypothetical protein
VLKATSLDFTLISRAQVWERYVPTFGPEVTPEVTLQLKTEGGEDYYEDEEGERADTEAVQFKDDGSAFMMGQAYRPVTYEESVTDYVNWEDFGHSVARTWDEVDLVWRRTYLSRKQLVTRFGKELGERIPLDWGGGKDGAEERSVEDEFTKKAADLRGLVQVGEEGLLGLQGVQRARARRQADPLELDGFFPCPRPLLGTLANDSLIPVPDFVFYQDQAEEVDDLTAKISELQDGLKVVGLYAGEKENNLASIVKAANNTLIPVPDWVKLKEMGGVKGVVEWWPIDMVVTALQALIGATPAGHLRHLPDHRHRRHHARHERSARHGDGGGDQGPVGADAGPRPPEGAAALRPRHAADQGRGDRREVRHRHPEGDEPA